MKNQTNAKENINRENVGKDRKLPPRAKELPGWFQRGGYKGVKRLDAHGWWLQISVRRTCFAFLTPPPEAAPIPQDLQECCEEALASLRERPICDPLRPPFDRDPFFSNLGDLVPRMASVIRPMTLRVLYRIKRETKWQLSPEQIRDIDRYERSSVVPFSFYFRDRFSGLDIPARPVGGSWIDSPCMIALGYPNSVLIKCFKDYLQVLRKSLKVKSPEAAKHTPDLAKWASQGVLKCMDLTLWALEKGCRMPDSLLVRALNPDPCDDVSEDGGIDEDMVRRTIRPLVSELLDWRSYRSVVLHSLETCASLELTHKYGKG